MLRNDGDRFVDVSGFPLPLGNDGAPLHTAFIDVDDDGDLDLIQANDFQQLVNSFFWENRGALDGGWDWFDRLPGTGLGLINAPMGFSHVDLDGDGAIDLWFSAKGRTRALRGDGAWGFVDVSEIWGAELPTEKTAISWTVLPVDYDGDGRFGVLITYGPFEDHFMAYDTEDLSPTAPWRFQADRLLQPDGESFVAADEVFPAPTLGNARGAAVDDLNGDGVPDLVIANLGAGPSVHLGRCTAAHRLAISLRDDSTRNRFGIGSLVEVEVAGGLMAQAVTAAGPGSFSGSGPELLFGLGDVERPEAIRVRWPDGEWTELADGCGDCRMIVQRDAAR
jgi:hypothetical protein